VGGSGTHLPDDFYSQGGSGSHPAHGSIALTFNAFIPLSHGKRSIMNNTYDFNWAIAPSPSNFIEDVTTIGNVPRIYDWFETDNREKPGQKGTSRLFTRVDVNGDDIGRLTTKDVKLTVGADLSYTGESRQLQGSPWELKNVKKKTPEYSGRIVYVNNYRSCVSLIKITAKDSDPFYWYAPSITMTITYHLEKTATGQTTIKVSGNHTSYPAYEALVNGKLYYGYTPSAKAPSALNLSYGLGIVGVNLTKISGQTTITAGLK
jgi:hypothetical protein